MTYYQIFDNIFVIFVCKHTASVDVHSWHRDIETGEEQSSHIDTVTEHPTSQLCLLG